MNHLNANFPLLAAGHALNYANREVFHKVPEFLHKIPNFFQAKTPEAPKFEHSPQLAQRLVDFKHVFGSKDLRAQFNDFLTNIFFQLDETKFFELMDEILKKNLPYEETYHELFSRIGEAKRGHVKTLFAQFRSLKVIKQTLSAQVKKLMNGTKAVDGYAEIGYPGRLIRPLQGDMKINGPKVVITEKEKFTDYLEAGFPLPYDSFIPLDDYAPICNRIGKSSMEFVICPIGLHHIPKDKIEQFVQSIHEVLKTGGTFILRDHDIKSKDLGALVNVVHSVFNAATGETLQAEAAEIRDFRKLSDWIKLMEKNGFKLEGGPLTTAGDPTENALLRFTKLPKTAEEAHLHALETEMKTTQNGYERPQFQTYLTSLEWHLVATAKEYADFIKDNPIHKFPFFKHVKVLWEVFINSCRDAVKASSLKSVMTSEYMMMNLFMLMTTTLELVFKGLAFAPLAFNRRAGEGFNPSIQLAKDSEEYAEFIKNTPFYEFPYFKKMWGLAKEFLNAPQKSFFSTYLTTLSIMEYALKGVGSLPLAKMYSGMETGKIHLIIEDKNDSVNKNLDSRIETVKADAKFKLKALEVPRYLQFKDIIRKIAYSNAKIKTIAGQEKIQIKVKVQSDDRDLYKNILGCRKLGETSITSDKTHKYVRLDVEVAELGQVIKTLEGSGVEIAYIHDF